MRFTLINDTMMDHPFHLHGFFFQVLRQPAALRETGIPQGEVVQLALEALGWIALEGVAGAWFLGRFPSARRTWIAALAIVLLGAAERVLPLDAIAPALVSLVS